MIFESRGHFIGFSSDTSFSLNGKTDVSGRRNSELESPEDTLLAVVVLVFGKMRPRRIEFFDSVSNIFFGEFGGKIPEGRTRCLMMVP